MDWSNPAQVMQAIYWLVMLGLFFMGYRAGDKV